MINATLTASPASQVVSTSVVGIELDAATAASVRDYLASNGLICPIIEVTDSGRMIFLAAAANNATSAVQWMRERSAVIHTSVELPIPATLTEESPVRWAIAPQECIVPPVVVVAAAIRAAARVRGSVAA